MNYQAILEDIYQEVRPLIGKGKVADYIPALARVRPDQFAMAVSLREELPELKLISFDDKLSKAATGEGLACNHSGAG